MANKTIRSHRVRVKAANEMLKTHPRFKRERISIIDREAFVEFFLLEDIVELYNIRLKEEIAYQSNGRADEKGRMQNVEKFSAIIAVFDAAISAARSAINAGEYKKVCNAIPEKKLMAMANSVSAKCLDKISKLTKDMLTKLSSDANEAEEVSKKTERDNEAQVAHDANVSKVNEWLSYERHNGSKHKKWSQKMQREKQEYANKIISALDELDEIVRNLQNFAAQYNSYIDEAGEKRDEARVGQLIKQKLRICGFIDRIKIYKSNIVMSANMKQMISQIGKLPEIIDTCKSLLVNQQEYFKVRKTIASISQDIDKSDEELAKLNGLLDPQSAEYGFGGFDDAAYDEKSEQFKAEWEASVQRVKSKVAPETVENAAGKIDYADILAKENRRK